MVLKDYEPGKSGRGMKVQRDQSIEILHQGEMDWWFGRTSSGQLGWIPKEIVENSEPQQVHTSQLSQHITTYKPPVNQDTSPIGQVSQVLLYTIFGIIYICNMLTHA